MPNSSKRSPPKKELNSLDLHSKDEARRRTDALLRAMLNRPHEPHVPKKKTKARPKK